MDGFNEGEAVIGSGGMEGPLVVVPSGREEIG